MWFSRIYKGKILIARNKDNVYSVISVAEKGQQGKQPNEKWIVTQNNSYPSFIWVVSQYLLVIQMQIFTIHFFLQLLHKTTK